MQETRATNDSSEETTVTSHRKSLTAVENNGFVTTTATSTITTTVRSSSLKREPRESHAIHAKNATRKGIFKPRSSPLDFDAPDHQHPLRGFYILFWMGMAWYAVTSIFETWMRDGIQFRFSLFYQMSDRGKDLFYSDAAMILSCFVVIPLVKLVQYRIIPLNIAWIINSIWLGSWFVTVISWTTQSGAFAIHCIAMLMKQASYLMSNTENFWKMYSLVPELRREIANLESRSSLNVDLEKELEQAKSELRQFEGDLNGKISGLKFPHNLTFLNFIDYMLIPTLVYEIEYPRTEKFRPLYFFLKAAGTFGTIALLIVIVENNIVPILVLSDELNFVTTIMKLIVPFMLCFMLFICNAFAELTYFADREFYEDWWNSTTFDEYARRWNKPVHEFLLRHLYLETISTYKLSRSNASLLTFFVSSVFHELVMAMTGKRLRPWLFLLQMFQLPLIMLARIPVIKNNKTLGNVIFWFGMFLGPPLLAALYAREHYMNP
ncbi:hypothetical protein HK100_012893 [Physocladia obscura]|uniref:O-acyltransferase n=1 Tax=Physocladia obscura TaxID=109957 RepID=A0AAD5XHA3_9FUNG|nr:hypothetical protein HK100_012893 [Physocladia obscura]